MCVCVLMCILTCMCPCVHAHGCMHAEVRDNFRHYPLCFFGTEPLPARLDKSNQWASGFACLSGQSVSASQSWYYKNRLSHTKPTVVGFVVIVLVRILEIELRSSYLEGKHFSWAISPAPYCVIFNSLTQVMRTASVFPTRHWKISSAFPSRKQYCLNWGASPECWRLSSNRKLPQHANPVAKFLPAEIVLQAYRILWEELFEIVLNRSLF